MGIRRTMIVLRRTACWCRQQNRDERELPLSGVALQLWDELAAKIGGETSLVEL
jgi:hypothetical protein